MASTALVDLQPHFCFLTKRLQPNDATTANLAGRLSSAHKTPPWTCHGCCLWLQFVESTKKQIIKLLNSYGYLGGASPSLSAEISWTGTSRTGGTWRTRWRQRRRRANSWRLRLFAGCTVSGFSGRHRKTGRRTRHRLAANNLT